MLIIRLLHVYQETGALRDSYSDAIHGGDSDSMRDGNNGTRIEGDSEALRDSVSEDHCLHQSSGSIPHIMLLS